MTVLNLHRNCNFAPCLFADYTVSTKKKNKLP